MIVLEKSVGTSVDQQLERAQQIARCNYRRLKEEPRLVKEFLQIVSKCCLFVNNWQDLCDNSFYL